MLLSNLSHAPIYINALTEIRNRFVNNKANLNTILFASLSQTNRTVPIRDVM